MAVTDRTLAKASSPAGLSMCVLPVAMAQRDQTDLFARNSAIRCHHIGILNDSSFVSTARHGLKTGKIWYPSLIRFTCRAGENCSPLTLPAVAAPPDRHEEKSGNGQFAGLLSAFAAAALSEATNGTVAACAVVDVKKCKCKTQQSNSNHCSFITTICPGHFFYFQYP